MFVKFSNKVLISIKYLVLLFAIPGFNSSMPDIIDCPREAKKADRKCKNLGDKHFKSFFATAKQCWSLL
jgi:hypothetical protein